LHSESSHPDPTSRSTDARQLNRRAKTRRVVHDLG
jgi:hypothetical protein